MYNKMDFVIILWMILILCIISCYIMFYLKQSCRISEDCFFLLVKQSNNEKNTPSATPPVDVSSSCVFSKCMSNTYKHAIITIWSIAISLSITLFVIDFINKDNKLYIILSLTGLVIVLSFPISLIHSMNTDKKNCDTPAPISTETS